MDPFLWPSQIPEIRTKRLLLRKLTSQDLNDIFAYSSDPDVARYLRFVEHKSIADAEAFLEVLMNSYKNNMDFIWGIESVDMQRLIGSCRLICESKHRSAEIGYVITKQWWGRGFAAEAIKGITEYVFANTGLNRIEGKCIVENAPSSRVLEKCGFHLEGVLRQFEWLKGRFVDVNLYSLLRSDTLTPPPQ